jgi:DNA-binding NtrC family response regulator
MTEKDALKFRLLIVDDDQSLLTTMRNLARHNRHLQVVVSEDPAEALRRVAQDIPYHIVLTDLAMPGVDGIQVLRAVKARSPDTRVLMVSGFGDQEMLISAIKQGLNDYMHKPFRPEEFNLMLINVIERWQLVQRVDKLERDMLKLEQDLHQKQQQVEALETEKQGLLQQLDRVKTADSSNNLQAALAKAAQEKAGKSYKYNVYKALTDLNELLDTKQITKDEFQSYRKTILDKAYRTPEEV